MGNKTSKAEIGGDTSKEGSDNNKETDIIQELIQNLETIRSKDIPTVLEKLKKVKNKINSVTETETKSDSESKQDIQTNLSSSSTSSTDKIDNPQKTGGRKTRSRRNNNISNLKKTRTLRLV